MRVAALLLFASLLPAQEYIRPHQLGPSMFCLPFEDAPSCISLRQIEHQGLSISPDGRTLKVWRVSGGPVELRFPRPLTGTACYRGTDFPSLSIAIRWPPLNFADQNFIAVEAYARELRARDVFVSMDWKDAGCSRGVALVANDGIWRTVLQRPIVP